MTDTRTRTDYETQQAVIERLDWAADVRSEHIGVAVTDGAVTLSGEAADLREKTAAIRAASEVRGVDAVVDDIVVSTSAGVSNDVDIARQVQDTIERLQGPRPNVVGLVREGVVTLTGVIESSDRRAALYVAIAALPGIGSVVDQMTGLPDPSVDQVRTSVIEVLERATQQETEGLRVEVTGHVAVIEGVVHSSYDKRAAGLAASRVPGVSHVDNRLVVTS